LKIEIEAEWKPYDELPYTAFNKLQTLRIAGCTASVAFKGDVWEWLVVSKNGWSEDGSGWVDTEEEAKAAAEALIRTLVKIV